MESAAVAAATPPPESPSKAEKYLSFRPTKIEVIYSADQDEIHTELTILNRTTKRLFYKAQFVQFLPASTFALI